MLAIAAAWVGVMLLIGGFVLDRTVAAIIVDNFDAQLESRLDAMIASVELSEEGELRYARPLSDQRYLEPYSQLYWQISRKGQAPYRSRSLWDRQLPVDTSVQKDGLLFTDVQLGEELLRVIERDATLPGVPVMFHFQIAQDRSGLDAQLARVRTTVLVSLGVLGLGLLILAALQAVYGLRPLRRVRAEIAAVRSGAVQRVSTDYVSEVTPLMHGINELLEQAEDQADAARRHAGNLAHALKTPMTVLVNESADKDTPLAITVRRQIMSMRRHVDHHLARARALGRRGALNMRSSVWPSLEALRRTVERMYPGAVTIDLDGADNLDFLGERQDLEEMAGNLIDNAAKYGGGRVFVTVKAETDDVLVIEVEDDGPGISPDERASLFQRGARLDTDKPGTGLGLAIVRDVAEIYGGRVELGESDDLGGLCARLFLPRADQQGSSMSA
ncbi:HAMP domain-containing histidine kinase [Pacificimonas sp. WHA3]|uniref:histidine kinase n=2 Tax=Pacificimonas pallii TaxID=2827236 RepID=A0ABS6SG58_9SPHN|nr:HAMP domain-containing histidine kinase [Pacificimonas pallii]